jgi:hypothetical protein
MTEPTIELGSSRITRVSSGRVEWKPIDGFPGYEIGSNGEARSWHLTRTIPRAQQTLPRVLTGGRDKDGYRRLVLCASGGVRRSRKHHILVLEAFVGPRPFPEAVTRHLDGDALNNSVDNLAWGTQAENIDDRERHKRDRAYSIKAAP